MACVGSCSYSSSTPYWPIDSAHLSWDSVTQSTPRFWVKHDHQTRVVIDYALGGITASSEKPTAEHSIQAVRVALKQALAETQAWRWAEIEGAPAGSLQVLQEHIQRQKPLLSPLRDRVIADLDVPFVDHHLALRAQHYQSLITELVKPYELDPVLVQAMIETQTFYNRWARTSPGSEDEAYGLMLVQPYKNGLDALVSLGEEGVPSVRDLYDPQYNLRLGIAYLVRLDQRYRYIVHLRTRQILILSAYHLGPEEADRLLRPNAQSQPYALHYHLRALPKSLREALNHMLLRIQSL